MPKTIKPTMKKQITKAVYPIIIGKDRYTTIELPTDLTVKEAERICRIIMALAIPNQL